MNILTDRLLEDIVIDGIKYPVYTDFRVWIKAAALFEVQGGNKNILRCV